MTKIEWVKNPDGTKGRTWNPVTGCSKTSLGCTNCYAESMARRLAGRYGYPKAPHHFDVTLHRQRLIEPIRRKKPTTYFVCSMGDLFHKDVPGGFIENSFGVMLEADWHIFQILTKRPERMREYMQRWPIDFAPPHIWLGGSISNQEDADRVIPEILATPAAVRFISYEPALDLADFSNWLTCWVCMGTGDGLGGECPICGGSGTDTSISWIVMGAETGPRRRPCELDWFRSARDQCVAAGVPFFLKAMEVNGTLVKMPELDGRVWDQMPEARQ